MIYSKSGRRLVGRLEELYTGNCPESRPCNPETVELHRKFFDETPDNAPMRNSDPTPYKERPFRLWRFAGQALSYVQALARWKLAGSPVPPPEALQQREAACQACPNWNSKKDGCRLCGCGLHGGSLAEKRKMYTEACPDDPPRWLDMDGKS